MSRYGRGCNPKIFGLGLDLALRITAALAIAAVSALPNAALAFPIPTGLIIGGISLLASPSSPSAGNLLVNGGFEAPAIPAPDGFRTFGQQGMPGWQILRGSVDVVHSRYWPPAPDGGSQSLDLTGTPGAATIQQNFPTEPGRYYLFSGWVAHNPQNPISVEGRIDVSMNGQPFAQLFHSDPLATLDDLHWASFSYWFRATDTTTTLTLSEATRSDGLSGSLLDGLSITAGPILKLPLTPGPPTGLQARAPSRAGAVLRWTSNSQNETGFQVWRKEGSGDWTQIALTPPRTTAYTDGGVQPSTSYTYRVRAVDNIYPSVWSNEARVTIP